MADYTVVPLEKTTVMKFVNIRGTQTLTAQESDTQFIVYDEAAAAADRAAENPQLLYSKLANIRSNGDTAEQQTAEMATAIATFKASARFITNTAKLAAAVDAKRLEWGAYLRDNRFSVSKTVGDAYFMQLAIAAQTLPQITTMKQLVWDNFLVCVIENNNIVGSGFNVMFLRRDFMQESIDFKKA